MKNLSIEFVTWANILLKIGGTVSGDLFGANKTGENALYMYIQVARLFLLP